MDIITRKIETFFAAYETRFAEGLAGNPNVDATTNAFAGCFIEANPNGVNCGQNNEQFRQVIPQGYQFYKSIGTTAMKIVSVESTELMPNHYSTKVHWQSFYKKDGKEIVIEFAVMYLLQYLNNELKIFAYITGDEQGELKKHGLVS